MKTTAILAATAAALSGLASPVSAGDCEGELPCWLACIACNLSSAHFETTMSVDGCRVRLLLGGTRGDAEVEARCTCTSKENQRWRRGIKSFGRSAASRLYVELSLLHARCPRPILDGLLSDEPCSGSSNGRKNTINSATGPSLPIAVVCVSEVGGWGDGAERLGGDGGHTDERINCERGADRHFFSPQSWPGAIARCFGIDWSMT